MGQKKRILIVEDNDIHRKILCEALASRGYLVEDACDGFKALEKLEDTSYDFLITDKQMPRMDGLELIDEVCLRQMDIIILLISGGFTREILEHAKSRGVMECLSKPFSFKEMIKAVRKVLQEDNVSEMTCNIEKHPKLFKDVVSVGE